MGAMLRVLFSQIASRMDERFDTLKNLIETNNAQKTRDVDSVKEQIRQLSSDIKDLNRLATMVAVLESKYVLLEEYTKRKHSHNTGEQ